jgi:hypothetical protein
MELQFPRFVYKENGVFVTAKTADEHASLIQQGWIEISQVAKETEYQPVQEPVKKKRGPNNRGLNADN